EVVVVAEAKLLDRHGVVLVDDRHDAEVEERPQRVPRVEVAPAVGQVGMRQQHLGHVAAVRLEGALVRCHEADLTDGGRRLPPLDAAPARPETWRTGGHGPRADDDDLPSAADQPRDLGGDRPHPIAPQPARAGEHVAAHLDDGPSRATEKPRLLDELAHGPAAVCAVASPLARARRTASATTPISAAAPSPVAPDTACKVIPRAANTARTAGRRSRVSARSSLPATTICGFAARWGSASASSRLIAS